MRLVCRLISGSTFVGFLAAIGMIVFWDVRNRPRCTIPNCAMLALSDDGSKVITTNFRHGRFAFETTWYGPVNVWDTQTGELVQTLIENANYYLWKTTPDDRLLAILAQDGSVRLIDLRDCTQERVTLTRTPRQWQSHKLELSPNGRWLVCYLSDTEDAYLHLPSREIIRYLRRGFACFNGNDDAFVYRTGLEDEKEMTIYDIKTGAETVKFFREWDYLSPSPDGKHWVVGGSSADSKSWDLDILDVEKRSTRMLMKNQDRADFSPDGRFLILWKLSGEGNSHWQRTFYEIATGRKTASTTKCWESHFSADSSLFVEFDRESASVIELPSCRLLWQRKGDSWMNFAEKKRIIIGMNRGSAEIIDARTGETHTSRLIGFSPHYGVTFTPSQDHFVVQGLEKRSETLAFWQRLLAQWKPALFAEDRKCVIVGETASGRELCRVFQDGKCFISADGYTLATVTPGDTGPQVILRIWDVQPAKAWRLAIATSLCAGLALLLVHYGMLRRWRHARTMASTGGASCVA